VPPNGLVVYTGTILTEEGKERKVNIDFEPFKPINTSLYLCDNKFHTEALSELLESDSKYVFQQIIAAALHTTWLCCPAVCGRMQQQGMRCSSWAVWEWCIASDMQVWFCGDGWQWQPVWHSQRQHTRGELGVQLIRLHFLAC
jgi:hypothetical protein